MISIHYLYNKLQRPVITTKQGSSSRETVKSTSTQHRVLVTPLKKPNHPSFQTPPWKHHDLTSMNSPPVVGAEKCLNAIVYQFYRQLGSEPFRMWINTLLETHNPLTSVIESIRVTRIELGTSGPTLTNLRYSKPTNTTIVSVYL